MQTNPLLIRPVNRDAVFPTFVGIPTFSDLPDFFFSSFFFLPPSFFFFHPCMYCMCNDHACQLVAFWAVLIVYPGAPHSVRSHFLIVYSGSRLFVLSWRAFSAILFFISHHEKVVKTSKKVRLCSFFRCIGYSFLLSESYKFGPLPIGFSSWRDRT